MSIYYVYFYLRPDFTPYYVGKGRDNRAYRKHKGISVPKDKSRIIIVQDNLTELQSFILERYYIRWFGRKNNNTGILRNLTDGGEGSSGRINSQDTNSLISKRVMETREYVTCPHCGKYGDKGNMMKYHFDNCGIKQHNTKVSIHLKNRVNKKIEDGSYHMLRQNMRIITCQYCGKSCNSGNYYRWHGDNCKKYQSQSRSGSTISCS